MKAEHQGRNIYAACSYRVWGVTNSHFCEVLLGQVNRNISHQETTKLLIYFLDKTQLLITTGNRRILVEHA
jgi:hypothetical protein